MRRECSEASPANADRDWSSVGSQAICRAMHVPELGVDLDVRPDLPRDAGAEIVAPLVLAGIQEVPVNR